MNNFDYKSYLKNNYLLQEELKDNGPEEKAFDKAIKLKSLMK